MKTKFFKSSLVLLIALFAVEFAYAQPYGPRNTNVKYPYVLNVIPDLTQDQEQKIQDMHTALLSDISTMRAELNVKHSELQLLKSQGASVKDQEAKLKEINDLHYQIQVARLQYQDDVRKILTDDQQTVYNNWIATRGNRGGYGMGGRRGYGHHGGYGRQGGYGRGYGNGYGYCRRAYNW